MTTTTITQTIQIRCIRKPDRNNPHRHIMGIGGLNPDNTRWYLSEEQAIQGMETGRWSFYVSAGGRTVNVIIATRNGNKYLKTQADGALPDNLLSLPECP